jgi:hypothetical protein
LTSASSDKLEHLAKSRPKKPKTRAPTRTTHTSNTQNPKITKIDSLESQTSDKSEKIDEGLDNFFKKSIPTETTQKPQIQPRGISKKFKAKTDHSNQSGFLSNPKSTSDDISKKSSTEETVMNSSVTQTSLFSARIEEVTRSRSSPNLGNKKPSQPISIPRNNSPGAEEIVNILEPNERVTSPLPSEHADLLAEMRAKQGKRSLAPTPTTTNAIVSESQVTNTNSTTTSSVSQLQGVKLRASVFGDVMKSPIKVFSTGNEELSTSLTETTRSSYPRQSNPPPLKQRPKSVVGILGAKFELSSNAKEDKIDNEIVSDISLNSDLSKVKKTSVFAKPRSTHSSTSSTSSQK